MRAMLTLTVLVAALALSSGAAFAQYSGIGAPSSAAGGIAPPPSISTPGAVGPLGGTSGPVTGSSGSTSSSPSPQNLMPGTGKFDQPNDPCIDTTGFGSSRGHPGNRC